MMLNIKSLSKRYGSGVQALSDVSLTVGQGVFGLLGPNGAGKSTLMRIVATLQEPDEGSVTFDGVDVLRRKDEIRRILGFLPQEFGLYPQSRAEALLDHFAVLKGISDRQARRTRVEALLRMTHLWKQRRHRLGTFSGGMKQRFGIAVALLADPKIVVVDEPTAGLDPAERVRFLNILADVGESSVVLLSTHIVDDVNEVCGRVAVIDDGRILLDSTPAEARARLSDRIWSKTIARSEVDLYRSGYDVLSTRLAEGRAVIRVFSETPLHESFTPAEPILEDVYFASLASRAAPAATAS